MRKFSKKHSIFRITLIIICLLFVGFGIYFLKSYLNVNKKLLFKVGNFKISTNTKEVYAKQENGDHVNTRISSSSPDPDIHCGTVGGVQNLTLRKNVPKDKQGFIPEYVVTSWDFNKLEFADATSKNKASKIDQSLENLSLYTDREKLIRLVFSKNFDPNARTPSPISTSPWRGLDSCGGHFSYPIYVQDIRQDKFDKVIYVESFEGQDSMTVPKKILVIKDGGDWMIFKEENYTNIEQYLEDSEHCFEKDDLDFWKCYEKVWSGKYRNSTENQEWIDYVIEMVNYSPVN